MSGAASATKTSPTSPVITPKLTLPSSFAKAVSAKSYDFDAAGNETTIDYPRMMKIVLDAGYRGYVGVEYEGSRLSEFEGIRATQHLLEKIAGQ